MPKPNGTIVCEECAGRGVKDRHVCYICDGEPRFDYAAVHAIIVRADELLAQIVKLERQVKKLKSSNGVNNKIVADYLKRLEATQFSEGRAA